MSDPNKTSAQPITDTASNMPPDALTQTALNQNATPQENGKIANNVPGSASKQKIIKIKEGEILRYKKRLFSSNWRYANITLYSNASFLISTRRHPSTPVRINCYKNSTLIIYGQQQLDLIPKRPTPPNGNKAEHMLAIGLINHAYSYSGRMKGTQIIFYWFSLGSYDELISWVVAFQNSLFSTNTSQSVKSAPDFQQISNSILLNNAANIANLNEKVQMSRGNPNDNLSYPVLMANTTAFNGNGLSGTGAGVAAVGTGLLAAGAQHQAIFGDVQRFNTFGLEGMAGSGYYGDDAMVGPFGFESAAASNDLRDGVPLAEIATVMNAADFLDCGLDCSAVDCSAAVDASGGDCSFDSGGDFAFAFAF